MTMPTYQRHAIKEQLDLAKEVLDKAKMIGPVKESLKHIDLAISVLFANYEYHFDPIPKKGIELYTDAELLAEIQKRLSERGYPARS